MVVVIVKPHFPPADHSRVTRPLIELSKMLLGCLICVVRMDPDRSVNPIVLFGVGNRRVEPLCRTATAANCEHHLDAGSPCACEHGAAVLIELGEFQMCVRVNNAHDSYILNASRVPDARRCSPPRDSRADAASLFGSRCVQCPQSIENADEEGTPAFEGKGLARRARP